MNYPDTHDLWHPPSGYSAIGHKPQPRPMRTTFSNTRFEIEFPGPTLKINTGGITGLTIHELHELGDLIQTALETTGNSKRTEQPYTMGNPGQPSDPINKSDALHDQYEAETGQKLKS